MRGLFKPGVSVLANFTLSTGTVTVTTSSTITVTAGGVSKTASLSVRNYGVRFRLVSFCEPSWIHGDARFDVSV